MIDLDSVLQRWAGTDVRRHALPGWAIADALHAGRRIASAAEIGVDCEPPDEEWVRFIDHAGEIGLLSIYYPLAIVVASLAEHVVTTQPEVHVVVVSGYYSKELRASASVLRKTMLANGWSKELDPERISLEDLFFETS